MFFPHLPIDIMRIVSLNRLRKSQRLFDRTLFSDETPHLGAAAQRSSSEALRSIRRRVAGEDDSHPAPSAARMEHIARIQDAIAAGRYHVSAADLAQKLIDHILAMRVSKP
jgi:anti-sigma28 factor (negative regulator of flagellin synthesis)